MLSTLSRSTLRQVRDLVLAVAEASQRRLSDARAQLEEVEALEVSPRLSNVPLAVLMRLAPS